MDKEELTKVPVILREGTYTDKELADFKEQYGTRIIDIYSEQMSELQVVLDPSGNNETETAGNLKNVDLRGDWIFFPWSSTLLHSVNENDNFLLRTNRNRDIITADEQELLRDFNVGIAGLSVGGNIATTLTYNGISKNTKLADFDTLASTNLNRIRAKLYDIGRSKIEIISEQIYDINPYANLTLFPEGIVSGNIEEFVGGDNPCKLIFEIIDDLAIKIRLRQAAKKHNIPLVMLTSIGDSVLIDVERYDQDPSLKPFNGLVEESDLQNILSGEVPKSEENKLVMKIVGRENVSDRVFESVQKIGKSLVGRPQLMSTITVEAGIASYIVRQIALGEALPSGRSRVDFSEFYNVS